MINKEMNNPTEKKNGQKTETDLQQRRCSTGRKPKKDAEHPQPPGKVTQTHSQTPLHPASAAHTQTTAGAPGLREAEGALWDAKRGVPRGSLQFLTQ